MEHQSSPRRCRGWEGRGPAAPLTAHQLAAAAAPRVPTRELAGSFTDFEQLLAQLGEPVLIELGKPTPEAKHLPRGRAGACPAAHNKALLGD